MRSRGLFFSAAVVEDAALGPAGPCPGRPRCPHRSVRWRQRAWRSRRPSRRGVGDEVGDQVPKNSSCRSSSGRSCRPCQPAPAPRSALRLRQNTAWARSKNAMKTSARSGCRCRRGSPSHVGDADVLIGDGSISRVTTGSCAGRRRAGAPRRSSGRSSDPPIVEDEVLDQFPDGSRRGCPCDEQDLEGVGDVLGPRHEDGSQSSRRGRRSSHPARTARSRARPEFLGWRVAGRFSSHDGSSSGSARWRPVSLP